VQVRLAESLRLIYDVLLALKIDLLHGVDHLMEALFSRVFNASAGNASCDFSLVPARHWLGVKHLYVTAYQLSIIMCFSYCLLLQVHRLNLWRHEILWLNHVGHQDWPICVVNQFCLGLGLRVPLNGHCILRFEFISQLYLIFHLRERVLCPN
jgi:hypothetical protein